MNTRIVIDNARADGEHMRTGGGAQRVRTGFCLRNEWEHRDDRAYCLDAPGMIPAGSSDGGRNLGFPSSFIDRL